MPFKSRAQERYFNANKARLEAQGVDVDEWNAASKGMSLPARSGVGHKANGKSHPADSRRDLGRKL